MLVVALLLTSLLPVGHSRRSDIFQKFVLTLEKEKYNKRLRPNFGGEPVSVAVSMYVGSLRSISEQTMDFKLELYFREYWTDSRLAFNPIRFSNHSILHLHESMVDMIWIPDTFFPNAIYSDNPSAGSITHRSLLRVTSDGRMLYSRRLSVTAECPMHLSLYPFDEQVCLLSIESYGYSTRDIMYEWKSADAVDMSDEMQLPAFLVKEVLQNNRSIELSTGIYSRLETCFVFKRSAAFYFVQLFIPATAIVVTAWLSLYMEHQSSFSDMVDVILAITFLYYSYNTVMPKVSYLKAMDIFLGTCFVFVFGALFKLAVMKNVKKFVIQTDSSSVDLIDVIDSLDHEVTEIQRETDSSDVDSDDDDKKVPRLPARKRMWNCMVKHHRIVILISYPVMFVTFCGVFFITIFSKKGEAAKNCKF